MRPIRSTPTWRPAWILTSAWRSRIPIKAGPHDVGFAFLKKSSALPITLIRPLERENLDGLANTGIPTLTQAIIVGPLNPTGPGETASRRRIFTCHPPR